ncbi:MAG: hypothetical protein IEMM0008_0863 [bacterium]|nr:MAG: hypothetical protein IEMM0008_0863 [bacterium]
MFRASYIIILLLFLFFYSCKDGTKPPNDAKNSHSILKRIEKNNNKIPSFACQVDVSSRSGKQRVSAKGLAFIDKKNQRIKIILTDTLVNEILLDLVIIKNKLKLYMYSPKGGIIITGRLNKLRLDKYIPNFKMDLKDLVHLVSGQSFIYKNPDKIIRKENSKYHLILLKKKKKKKYEILSINKSSRRVNKLAVYKRILKKEQEQFNILYRKYRDYKDFYFPTRSDFYHIKTKSKTIIYLSNLKFKPSFSDRIFKLKHYPKAKLINDSL